MAKKKNEHGEPPDSFPNEGISVAVCPEGVLPEEMPSTERATVPPPPNGTATARRKAKRGRTDRTYWVCGRRSPGSPVQHIMPQETVGRARKQLETVRLMPAYDGWELWTTRETRVS